MAKHARSQSRYRLPNEMWREIIAFAGTIPYEFDPQRLPTINERCHRRQVYLTQWQAAFRNRLTMALVCKSWNSISFEFLYSSFIVNCEQHFTTLCRLVQIPRLARRILRITITARFNLDGLSRQVCFQVLELCVNLVIYTSFIPHTLFWPATNRQLIQLEYDQVADYGTMAGYQDRGILQPLLNTISMSPSLEVLRLTNATTGYFKYHKAPLYLPNLQELEIDFLRFSSEEPEPAILNWLQKCQFPRLKTLTINAQSQSTPTLLTFGEQISTLGLDGTPAFTPSPTLPRISIPKTRTLVLKHYFERSDWTGLNKTLDLREVQTVEILFTHQMIRPGWGKAEKVQWNNLMDIKLMTLLKQWQDDLATPTLGTIVFDLGPSTQKKVWNDGLRDSLQVWFEDFNKLRPQVHVCAAHYDELTADLVSIPLGSLLTRANEISESVRLIKQDRKANGSDV